MADTAVEVRRTLDLTRAPTEQWNSEMMRLVSSQVLKRASTKAEQVYCLAVADALGLNPFIDEIYFIPSKSRDGSGPGIKPYIGRNGLVKKATERASYFESDTVHENDKFTVRRKADGERTVTHSYGSHDRGEIVGAYAFLHFRNGDIPAFFYAKLEEYLPTFDQEWKMDASPWGNQRSAMIEKCFDAETEILTDRGFEPFPIAEGRVLQVTDAGLEAVDARPFRRSYEGPMVTHSSREVDFAVTPNHDLLLSCGRMEAREVYERARSRPVAGLAVVRSLASSRADEPYVSDASLTLAGYFMADGHADSKGVLAFNLSRPRKVRALRALGFPLAERPGCSASALPSFVLAAKRINLSELLALSSRQVRVFVDAWMEFDGDVRRRLYCTDPERLGAFEVAAVHAGYSVSPRRSRLNLALSDRPNYVVTLSERAASGLRRWGRGDDARSRQNAAGRPGLAIAPADGRGVWCVTVPSGVIVVRRRGFSMLCGNCSMIGAGRKRLDLGNVLMDGEIARFEQQQGPPRAPEAPAADLDFGRFTQDAELADRLRVAAEAAGWPAAKCEMVMLGCDRGELEEIAGRVEQEAIAVAAAADGAARGTPGPSATEPAPEGTVDVTDADVLPDLSAEDLERVAILRKRIDQANRMLDGMSVGSDDHASLSDEIGGLERELRAIEDPSQASLL